MLSGCIILYPHYLTLHYFYYFCSRKQRRRVGRVIDRAGLEIRYTLMRIGGLNPSLSARTNKGNPIGSLFHFSSFISHPPPFSFLIPPLFPSLNREGLGESLGGSKIVARDPCTTWCPVLSMQLQGC